MLNETPDGAFKMDAVSCLPLGNSRVAVVPSAVTEALVWARHWRLVPAGTPAISSWTKICFRPFKNRIPRRIEVDLIVSKFRERTRCDLRVVSSGHVCGEEGSIVVFDVEAWCGTLLGSGRTKVGRRLGIDILVGVIDQERVLSLGPLSVVQPSLRVLCFTREVSRREVLGGSELTKPPLSHGINDKVSNIEITMSLMSGKFTRLHGPV